MRNEVISVDDDLLDAGSVEDPYPYYRELRERGRCTGTSAGAAGS